MKRFDEHDHELPSPQTLHSARHSSAATSWDLDETPEDDMSVLAQEKRSEDTIPH